MCFRFSIELLFILSLTYLQFYLGLWCPQGRAASPSGIALLSLPLLLTSQCLAEARHRNLSRRSTQRLGLTLLGKRLSQLATKYKF